MSIFSTGGRFAPSGCYALLSREGNVLDLSYGMRDLCRRFQPREEAPSSFKTLVVEKDHPLLLDHLERVWKRQESDVQDLHVARSFGDPLQARIFSVPAPGEKAVQSFLAIEGREQEQSAAHARRSENRRVEDGVGFMVLRPDGDFDRLLIAFCDARLRRSLGVEAGALVNRSLYQVFNREGCRCLSDAVRDSRSSGSPRRCSFDARPGVRLRVIVFVTGSSAMVLTEPDQGRSGTDEALSESHEVMPPAAVEMERFMKLELRPGLRALRNLARSVEKALPEGAAGSCQATVMEQLSAQIFDAVEKFEGRSRETSAVTEGDDVLRRLVEGVRDVAHPALASKARSVAVVDETAPETAIVSTYGVECLQQILVDLLGEAATVAAMPDLECRIAPREEDRGRVLLEFEVSARRAGSGLREADEGPDIDGLRRRPMFKACRRYLRALGAELDVELEGRACHYRFQLAFGKLSALETV